MTQIRVVRTTDTSNPVGDVVIRREGRRNRDVVSALTDQIRKLVARGRSHVTVRG